MARDNTSMPGVYEISEEELESVAAGGFFSNAWKFVRNNFISPGISEVVSTLRRGFNLNWRF
jgi:hypothetical protein